MFIRWLVSFLSGILNVGLLIVIGKNGLSIDTNKQFVVANIYNFVSWFTESLYFFCVTKINNRVYGIDGFQILVNGVLKQLQSNQMIFMLVVIVSFCLLNVPWYFEFRCRSPPPQVLTAPRMHSCLCF